jgi:hypothetical protein
MKMSAPSPPPMPAVPPPDPQFEAIKAQAAEEKLQGIQDRTIQRNNDLLLRYGARTALGSVSMRTA